MASLPPTFDPRRVKPEPFEWEDYESPPRDDDGVQQVPAVTPYEEKMGELDYFLQMEDNYIELSGAGQSIRAEVAKKEKEIIAQTPWMRNRPEARATTKFRQMQLAARRRALQEHTKSMEAVEQRRNPRRSATMKLKEDVYKEDVEFLGCYDQNGQRKKPKRKSKK